MPKLPLLTAPQAPQGPAQYAPESQAKPDPWPITATRGLMGALGFGDDSTASKVGELAGALAPFVGPALKGLGVAAPLISIYKDAEGVPSAAFREMGTQRFIDRASQLPEHLAKAAQEFAQDYPRVAAHMTPTMGEPPSTMSNAEAYVMHYPGQVKTPLVATWTPAGEESINKRGIDEARRQMYHEGTHAAQHLGNKDFPELYVGANDMMGYELNPFELRANRAALRAQGNTLTKGNPTAIQQLKDIIPFFKGEPVGEETSAILARRAGEAPQAAVAASKPTAKFVGHQEGLGPLYDIKGGPSDGSTVSAETLKKMGIDIPPTPKPKK